MENSLDEREGKTDTRTATLAFSGSWSRVVPRPVTLVASTYFRAHKLEEESQTCKWGGDFILILRNQLFISRLPSAVE